MNDGVRRSLLAAKIARMQAEDAREAAKCSEETAESTGQPGWGTGFGAARNERNERPQHTEMPVSSSVLGMLIQRVTASKLRVQPQDGVGQA